MDHKTLLIPKTVKIKDEFRSYHYLPIMVRFPEPRADFTMPETVSADIANYIKALVGEEKYLAMELDKENTRFAFDRLIPEVIYERSIREINDFSITPFNHLDKSNCESTGLILIGEAVSGDLKIQFVVIIQIDKSSYEMTRKRIFFDEVFDINSNKDTFANYIAQILNIKEDYDKFNSIGLIVDADEKETDAFARPAKKEA